MLVGFAKEDGDEVKVAQVVKWQFQILAVTQLEGNKGLNGCIAVATKVTPDTTSNYLVGITTCMMVTKTTW